MPSSQRAYGSRWQHNGYQGAPLGSAIAGLGDDPSAISIDPISGDIIDAAGNVLLTGPSAADVVLPGSSPSQPSILPGLVQTGFNDVFQFAKLFNPVPAGTTIVTGPNGQTYITRAAAGQAANTSVPGFSTPGSSILPLLLGGAAVLAIAAAAFGGKH